MRWVALATTVAYVTCVMVEPLPDGPEPVQPWWYDAAGVASLLALVVACAALAVGARWAPVALVVNGLGMVSETILCPGMGHHRLSLGWWWDTQLGLSVAILAAGVVLAVAATVATSLPDDRTQTTLS